jgi:hypothetical protein
LEKFGKPQRKNKMSYYMSARDYIYCDDFEGAKSRFDIATARWKEHWFNTCREIFENDVKWAKRYKINIENQTIQVIFDIIDLDSIDSNSRSVVYLIEAYKQGQLTCTKIGTAHSNFHSRRKDYLGEHNSKIEDWYRMGKPDTIVIRGIIYTNPEGINKGNRKGIYCQKGLDIEDDFRDYFKKRNEVAFTPNDRFMAVGCDEEAVEYFYSLANKYMAYSLISESV